MLGHKQEVNMPRVGVVVGNGFAINYRITREHTFQLPDPSDPFTWDFNVPGNDGLNWKSAFPLLKQTIDDYPNDVRSFDVFASLLFEIKLRGNRDSVRLDAEARQFLAFAYSVFQEEADKIGFANWRWINWLADHASMLKTAVSFNYDRILEKTANSAGIRLVPFAVAPAHEGVFLLKPHGSIDFECDPHAISLPKSTYPLSNWATLNDVPLIKLNSASLRQPRQEAFIALPAETSPYLNYQWVAPGYQTWKKFAGELSHCVFVGLSYWQCDRQEIDFIIDTLAKDTIVIVANPHPPVELLSRVVNSGRRLIEWLDGPMNINDVF